MVEGRRRVRIELSVEPPGRIRSLGRVATVISLRERPSRRAKKGGTAGLEPVPLRDRVFLLARLAEHNVVNMRILSAFFEVIPAPADRSQRISRGRVVVRSLGPVPGGMLPLVLLPGLPL